MDDYIGILQKHNIKRDAEEDKSITKDLTRSRLSSEESSTKLLGYFKISGKTIWVVYHIDYGKWLENKESYDDLEEAIERYNKY